MKILLHRAYSYTDIRHIKDYKNFDRFFEILSLREPIQDRPSYNFGKTDGVVRYIRIEYHKWLEEMGATYSIITKREENSLDGILI